MAISKSEKYPDTYTFHYFNANPKNRITGDCSFRAIATGLNQDYNKTVMEMAEMMCKTGYALNDAKGEERYLESKGWIKMPQPRKADNTKYTGEEFCRWLDKNDNRNKRIICHIGGNHTVCIVKEDLFRIWDTWNSSNGCIGNYWVKSI